jgi:hypothetical protein
MVECTIMEWFFITFRHRPQLSYSVNSRSRMCNTRFADRRSSVTTGAYWFHLSWLSFRLSFNTSSFQVPPVDIFITASDRPLKKPRIQDIHAHTIIVWGILLIGRIVQHLLNFSLHYHIILSFSRRCFIWSTRLIASYRFHFRRLGFSYFDAFNAFFWTCLIIDWFCQFHIWPSKKFLTHHILLCHFRVPSISFK